MRTILAILALTLPATAQYAQWACHQVWVSCPCPGSAPDVGGCPNSVSDQGALLVPEPEWAIDSPSVSNDVIQIHASRLPIGSVALFCQGTTSIAPTVFGDGVRCVGGTMLRLATRVAQDSHGPGLGVAGYLTQGSPPLSVAGQVPPEGGMRVYQVWYRNAAAFCTAATFNMTNTVTLFWQP